MQLLIGVVLGANLALTYVLYQMVRQATGPPSPPGPTDRDLAQLDAAARRVEDLASGAPRDD